MRVKEVISKISSIRGGLYNSLFEKIDGMKINFFTLENGEIPEFCKIYYHQISDGVEMRLVSEDRRGVYLFRWFGFGNLKVEFLKLRQTFDEIADDNWSEVV